MEPFAQWAVDKGLVLINQIQEWTSVDSERFAQQAIREHRTLNDGRWLDALADIPESPPVLPLSNDERLAMANYSPFGRRLIDEFDSILLQVSPVTVVATVDPFRHKELMDVVFEHYPSIDNRCVVITPHDFHRISGLIHSEVEDYASPIRGEAEPWSKMLGSGYGFRQLADVVGALWSAEPPIPVISDRSVGEQLLPIDGCVDAFIFATTQRRAWVIAAAATRPEITEAVLQSTGKQAMICACTPDGFERIRERSAPAAKAKVSTLEMSGPLNVNEWGQFSNPGDLITRILFAAIEMGASDVHFEPKQDNVRVRFRINGSLRTQAPLPAPVYNELVRDIKVTKNMNQLVRGKPQDGHGHVSLRGVRYDQRYSIIPTETGEETIVCRIFDSKVRGLPDLSLGAEAMRVIRWALRQEAGMVLLTGPTGSGKTSTLYALLRELNRPDQKLFSIEDPVEKNFPDAVQIGVNAETGWTFGEGLRRILRQDPDVILVGELRDEESARVAINAALTGHKVLTTTHANDAVGAILRLTESFGIDPVTLSLSLRLSIAQRLIPKLCPFCRVLRPPDVIDIEYFPHVEVASPCIGEAPGCPACRHTGTLGRHLVAEYLAVSPVVAEMIAAGRPPKAIRDYASGHGLKGLDRQATELMLNGEISVFDASRFLRSPVI